MTTLPDDIVAWATEYGITSSLDTFATAEFDTFEVLEELDAADLDALQIVAPGLRKKILRAVRELPSWRARYQAGDAATSSTADEIGHDSSVSKDDALDAQATTSAPEILEAQEMLRAISQRLSQQVSANASHQQVPYPGPAIDGDELVGMVVRGQRARLSSALQAGADPNARSISGSVPLLLATALDDLETVELLLAHGADVNVRGERGTTPLLLAVTLGFRALALQLAAQPDVDLNAKDDDGATALLIAVSQADADLVEGLLATNRINIRYQDVRGHSCLYTAAADLEESNPHSERIIQALLARNAGTPPTHLTRLDSFITIDSIDSIDSIGFVKTLNCETTISAGRHSTLQQVSTSGALCHGCCPSASSLPTSAPKIDAALHRIDSCMRYACPFVRNTHRGVCICIDQYSSKYK